MYQHPQQAMTLPMQPGRFPNNPPGLQAQPIYQKIPTPPLMNSQNFSQQSANLQQGVVGPYSMIPNQIMNNNAQRPPNSQNQGQNKGGSYVQLPHPSLQQSQSANSRGAPLMQPPSLNMNNDESARTNQFFQQRAPMTQSNNNNMNNDLDVFQQQDEQQIWTNQAQIASMFWEQRCMTMLQRFQWFYQRFQILRNQYGQLSEEMQKMDSEEEWHRFQQHHDQFHEKIEEMEQELGAVLSQNQQLLQQQQAQQNQNVWEQRYQELLGNFKSLQDEMAHMEGGGNKTGDLPREQYQQLQEHCNELEYQYGQVLNELQKYRETEIPDARKFEQQIGEYVQQLESYKTKLNNLHSQNEELQNMFTEMQQQNERLKQQRKKSAGIDKNKYEQLVRQVEHKEDQIQKLQNDFKVRNNMLNNYNQIQTELSSTNRDLQQKSRQLQQTSRQLQQKNRELEQKTREAELYRKQAEQKRRESEQKNKDVEQKVKETDQKTKEIQYRTKQIQQKNREIQQKSRDIQHKNREIQQRNRDVQELKRLLNQKDLKIAIQLNQNRSKLMVVEETARAKLKQSFETQKRGREKKIAELERQVDELRSQVSKLTEQSFKIQNVQKKLTYLNQENTNLSESLKKKNQELIQLRSLTYQLDKLKNVETDLRKVVEEKEKSLETIKKKTHQNQAMKQEIEKLSSKIQELSNKRLQFNAKSLMAEIEDLNEQFRKKEGQIYKLKHLSQLKEEYSLKIEEELRLAKSKIITLEQTLQNERQNNRQKQISSNYKSNDYQKKIKNLDYQFNVQLKGTLEREVTVLRKQNIQKQEIIRRQEENQVILTSKLAIFEKQKENFDQDLGFRKNKEKEMQLVIEEQLKKYQQLERTYKVREQVLSAFQQSQNELNSHINSLKIQIEEHNTLIKSKNKTIEDLQNNINSKWNKGDDFDKLTIENNKLKVSLNIANQEIQTLKFNDQRLSRSKALSVNNMNTSRKEFDRQENIVVSHLQQQNQLLKQEIAKLLQKITDNSFFPQKSQPLSPNKDSRKITQIPVTLNKRLNQFNSKLQNAISANDIQLPQSPSKKATYLWERQRQELINNYECQIKELKDQLLQVKNSNSRVSQQNPLPSSRKSVYQDLEGQRLKEEVAFYKGKNTEQEERNSILVKVNEELKSKIESILKIKQTTSTLDYYKNTSEKLGNQNDNLKQKIKTLTQQNKQYRIQLGVKNSKLTQDYQFKIMELQLVIQQNQRKIAYLQSEKVTANNEKATLVHDLKLVNLDKGDKKKPASEKSEPHIIHNSRNSDYLTNTKKIQNYVLESYTPDYPTYSGIEQDYSNVIGQIRGTSYAPPRNYERPYTKEKSSRSYLESFGSRSKARV